MPYFLFFFKLLVTYYVDAKIRRSYSDDTFFLNCVVFTPLEWFGKSYYLIIVVFVWVLIAPKSFHLYIFHQTTKFKSISIATRMCIAFCLNWFLQRTNFMCMPNQHASDLYVDKIKMYLYDLERFKRNCIPFLLKALWRPLYCVNSCFFSFGMQSLWHLPHIFSFS